MAALAAGPIRIRVGIHTGEPILDPPKYVGLDVHKAARIMAAGHGGQVLLSQTNARSRRGRVRRQGARRAPAQGSSGVPERALPARRARLPTACDAATGRTCPIPATPFLGRVRELRRGDGAARERRSRSDADRPGRNREDPAPRRPRPRPRRVPGAACGGSRWRLSAIPVWYSRRSAQALGLVERAGPGRRRDHRRGAPRHALTGAARQRRAPAARDRRLGRALRDADGAAVVVTSRERLAARTASTCTRFRRSSTSDAVSLFVARARALDSGFEPLRRGRGALRAARRPAARARARGRAHGVTRPGADPRSARRGGSTC